MFTFVIPGKPQAKGRARTKPGSGRPYTPRTTASFERYVQQLAVLARVPKATGPVRMEIDFKFRRARKSAGHHTARPDLSNLVKAIEDALNTIAYDDDAQISELAVRKFYGETDETVVKITPL
ncbi:MAG: RusA family crossover junction endodeoxyribonuclease [Gemmatimonadota bacterium]